jgi:hypothetical protein
MQVNANNREQNPGEQAWKLVGNVEQEVQDGR